MNSGHTEAYVVPAMDFTVAGQAASTVKRKLQLAGYPPQVIRRAAIAIYELEMNLVIHGNGGRLTVVMKAEQIEVLAEDTGPGIVDVEQAMEEGYTTAPAQVRELGFGAGMGLPNIKRNTDYLDIASVPGKGTTIKACIYNEKTS